MPIFKKRAKILFCFILFFFIFSFFIDINNVLASSNDVLGIDTVDEELVLEKRDPRSIAAGIINIFLGFLSIIAVSLIIYAGFVWMTSEGNEEKISKAKGILKSATIGLLIVLSAWGIVSFIFRELAGDYGGGSYTQSPTQHFQGGIGAIGACTVESVYPEPGKKNVPRNTMIMVTFKEEIDSSTITNENVLICEEKSFDFNSFSCSDSVDFNFSTNDDKIFVIFPNEYLGNEDSLSSYWVYFSNDVLKSDGSESIFNTCSPQYLLWNFEVSNKLDLTPPKVSSIFPPPDNYKDELNITGTLETASAKLSVIGTPNYYQEARVNSVIKGGGTTSEARAIIANKNYNEDFTSFSVTISDSNKAQLVSGSTNLGLFDINNNKINFTNYFSFEIDDDFIPGNSWNVSVSKVVLGDKLKIGNSVYNFVNDSSNGYNIEVKTGNSSQATEICNRINDTSANVDAVCSSSTITLASEIAGPSGNLINLESSNESAITIEAPGFSGGSEPNVSLDLRDKKDVPMNASVQINFNEAVNPLTASGKWDDNIAIKVLKEKQVGENCSEYEQDYDENYCQIKGEFTISSNYKTVEFVSEFKCGTNGCGGDIFCLPASSNIRVEIDAANLFNCNDDTSCANKSPFSSCVNSICQDQEENRYPLSNLDSIDGIMDAAANSLDGDGDSYSFGPFSYYYKNDSDSSGKDSYAWSFWTSNQIDSNPPVIVIFDPENDPENRANLFTPVEIFFDKLLSSNSLRTGQTFIEKGGQKVFHNMLNLISPRLVGYWVDFENQDTTLDSYPDKTKIIINHAKFFEEVDYDAQAGSGITDIYQNCFKPSASIECNATNSSPSCCWNEPRSNSFCQ